MKKKISIKNLYLIALISMGLIGLGIGSTYAVFTASATIDNPIVFTSTLSYTSDVIETVEVTIAPGETKYTTLDITNTNDAALNYAIWYIDEGKDIDLGIEKEQDTEDMCPNITTCTGFESGTTAMVGLYIRNNTSSTITVTVGVSASIGNIVLDDNMTIFPNQTLPANETATTDLSNFTYKIDSWDMWNDGSIVMDIPDGSVLLTKYIGTDTIVNIPSTYTIDGVEYTPIVYGDAPNGEATFMNNDVIEEVNFADGVSFADFDNEETLAFNSIAHLFTGCTSLLTVTGISNNIESMVGTFERCTSLAGNIVIESPNVVDARYSFSETSQLITVMVPANSTTFTTFDSLTLPSNVTLSTF